MKRIAGDEIEEDGENMKKKKWVAEAIPSRYVIHSVWRGAWH